MGHRRPPRDPGRLQAGDRERSAGLLAGHFARTGFEVIEILEPGYVAADLPDAVRDVGGEIPKKRRSNAHKEPR